MDRVLQTTVNNIKKQIADRERHGKYWKMYKSPLETGFRSIDRVLHGLAPGHFVVLAGRPGTGKTSLMLNIALNIAIEAEKKVQVFSLEMTGHELGVRMLSSLSKIPAARIKEGNLREKEVEEIETMTKRPVMENILVNDKGGLSIQALRSYASRAVKENDVKVIFIDYLQLLSDKTANSRYLEVSNISRTLKSLAKTLKIPVVCLSQLSRSVEMRSVKVPVLSDLRDSGSIEEDADVVLLLSPKGKSRYKFLLEVAKNRHGDRAKILLDFDPDITTFKK